MGCARRTCALPTTRKSRRVISPPSTGVISTLVRGMKSTPSRLSASEKRLWYPSGGSVTSPAIKYRSVSKTARSLRRSTPSAWLIGPSIDRLANFGREYPSRGHNFALAPACTSRRRQTEYLPANQRHARITKSARAPAFTDHYTDHMAKQVTATDAKATILRLLDDAAAGEEIEITRHGRPVARLVPASGARSLKGSFRGVAMTAVEEEQLFSTGEAWNAS